MLRSNRARSKIRKNLGKGYGIPNGGFYRWVTCPNYLGEILEWIGWAIACWSLAGCSFAIWVIANLVPRARSNHQWYHEQFKDYPKKRKILVCGTDINLNPTPELTWALILGLARNFKEELDNMYQGYWQTTIGIELKGKILGLIGLGRVGSEVAKIGKAFGMQVMAWSENLSLDKCKELDVLPCSKDDLITNSDVISIHVQGGERYKDCITIKELDKMKKTAFLINTSRGSIVSEDDLIIALSTNEIAGAGLDVYEKEPLPENNKLRFLPNVLLTPHIGYVTAENYQIFYSQMIESLEACVNGKPIRIIEK